MNWLNVVCVQEPAGWFRNRFGKVPKKIREAVFSVAAARLGSALGAAQGVSRSATARLWLKPAPERLSPAKFGNNCLRLRLDLATQNSTSTATQGIYGGQ